MVQIQFINKILRTKSLDLVIDNDITPDYFTDYSDEFNFILEHYRKYGNVPDTETFCDNFNDFDFIEVSESDDYLVSKIQEEYQYTQIVPIIKQAADILQSDSIEACDYLKSQMAALQQFGAVTGIDIIAQAKSRYELWKKRKDSDTPWGLSTGFQEIDEAVGRFAPGEEFAIYFARTNQGKSWVLGQTLTANWKMGRNVGVISPEMGADLFGWRFDTLNAHFSNSSLYSGRDVPGYDDYISNLINGDYKNKFLVATPQHFNRKITVSKLRKFIQQNKIDLLAVDGLKYLTDERYKRGDNVTTSLTNISEDIMELSCEAHIPIIGVMQSNREGANETGDTPAIENIRDSDGPAQNATKVFAISQRDSKLKIKAVKNRTGKVGLEFCYDWDIDTGTFKFTSNYGEAGKTSADNIRKQRGTIENKQPLRRVAESIPF